MSQRLGKTFYGSVSAGSFLLGLWEIRCYRRKKTLVDKRLEELSMDPIELGKYNPKGFNFQRFLVRGKWRHEDEILVGPREPPIANVGSNSSNPQGYYVITPLERSDREGVILVNRGWVPKHFVKQSLPWEKPTENVEIVGITFEPDREFDVSALFSKILDEPTFFWNASSLQKKLFWMDKAAIEAETRTTKDSPIILQETFLEKEKRNQTEFPLKPNVSTVGEFKTTPKTHIVYAISLIVFSEVTFYKFLKLIFRR